MRTLPETLTIVTGKTHPFPVGHRPAGRLVDIMVSLEKGLKKNRATSAVLSEHLGPAIPEVPPDHSIYGKNSICVQPASDSENLEAPIFQERSVWHMIQELLRFKALAGQ